MISHSILSSGMVRATKDKRPVLCLPAESCGQSHLVRCLRFGSRNFKSFPWVPWTVDPSNKALCSVVFAGGLRPELSKEGRPVLRVPPKSCGQRHTVWRLRPGSRDGAAAPWGPCNVDGLQPCSPTPPQLVPGLSPPVLLHSDAVPVLRPPLRGPVQVRASAFVQTWCQTCIT
jgi:hypothetical protein